MKNKNRPFDGIVSINNQKGMVMYKTFVYWPDGGWREAPDDGFVYQQDGIVYMWDGFLESWVDGWKGDIADFTPANMPSKVSEVPQAEESKGAKTVPCECGALKTSNPNHHSHWCPRVSS